MKFPKINLTRLLFLSLISFILPASTTENEDLQNNLDEFFKIHELTDSNFDILVDNGTKNPWLIIFFVNTCPHCIKAKSVLQQISKNPTEILESNTKLGIIDCDINIFSCYRFKISRIPYIIMLDSNNMYEFQDFVTEEILITFIKLKKDYDNGLLIPNVLSYFDFLIKLLEEVTTFLNSQIEKYLQENYEIKIEWKNEYTLSILVMVILTILVVEYIIIKLLCRKKNIKKDLVKDEKNKIGSNNENVEEDKDKNERNRNKRIKDFTKIKNLNYTNLNQNIKAKED